MSQALAAASAAQALMGSTGGAGAAALRESVSMLAAIIGICVSLLLYVATEWLFIAVTTKRVQSLPAQWREHPALAPDYATVLEAG